MKRNDFLNLSYLGDSVYAGMDQFNRLWLMTINDGEN
jgi:hypothetical protein